jgi:hypothetical protein
MAPLMARRAGAITAENEARTTLLAEAQTLLRSRTFPPVPLEVLTGTKNYEGSPDDAAEWQALHAELASLSPRGQQTFVECGHDMPLSRPDAVIDAVMRVQRDDLAVRSGRSAPGAPYAPFGCIRGPHDSDIWSAQ